MSELKESIETMLENHDQQLKLLDELLEHTRRQRQHVHKRRMVYQKMLTALKRGDVKRAHDLHKHEMPRPKSFIV